MCVTGKFGLGPNVAVSLLDVSETGIRLVLKTALTAGHEVEVSLDSVIGRQAAKIPGQVVWCVPMADGNHCLGVRFSKPLKWSVLLALTHF
jgi:PilZ domain